MASRAPVVEPMEQRKDCFPKDCSVVPLAERMDCPVGRVAERMGCYGVPVVPLAELAERMGCSVVPLVPVAEPMHWPEVPDNRAARMGSSRPSAGAELGLGMVGHSSAEAIEE